MVWARQSARPYLDKVPSIKSIIEENAPFLSSPAASASAISILDELREKMASHADRRGSGERMSDEKVQRLREYVTRKIDKVRQKNQDLDDDLEEDMMGLGPWEGMKIYVESGPVDQQEVCSSPPCPFVVFWETPSLRLYLSSRRLLT
ncbi:hypothetical protein BS47DRAFT_1345701 [Hydnum rufescens UP504]|uniref:Uncharacterized protein n=1 Tax=Hydnum rufescens UP504 TaxID=1448309 RepID=A0A9P6AWW0_9AGAM|nr:hypothetical protein BS47DRAFT_1345701 [Hydnum rufescens UP504]